MRSSLGLVAGLLVIGLGGPGGLGCGARPDPPAPAADPNAELRREWGAPSPPFHLVGPVYYVGAANIASYLLVGSAGMILVDSGTREMAPQLLANIRALGFEPTDVEILLVSHAHWDHVEGLAAVKRATGARLLAIDAEVPALSSGRDLSALGDAGWEPVAVDRVLRDGEVVRLGDLALRALWTPGHTQGCTTWTTTVRDRGRAYDVVFAGVPAANAGVPLTRNRRHPTIAADLAHSLRVLRALRPDVFLTAHPADLFAGKLDRLRAGEGPAPILESGKYAAWLDEAAADLETRLRAEGAAR